MAMKYSELVAEVERALKAGCALDAQTYASLAVAAQLQLLNQLVAYQGPHNAAADEVSSGVELAAHRALFGGSGEVPVLGAVADALGVAK